MADYYDVIFWSLVGSLFSIIGGLILISNKKTAELLSYIAAPFAAGALLGAAFFDLLPEAVEINAEGAAFRWAVVGIVAFFLLEHYLHWFHHHHEHKKASKFKRPTAPMIITGDTVHNVIDGVAIGAAFTVSAPVGIVTAIAVAAHEIPQEIGDFGLLLKQGMRKSRVIAWNVFSAFATLAAAVYTFYLGSQDSLPLGAILGVSAGLFIYIAASDLIPTIHQEAEGRFAKLPAILLISGLLVVGVATEIAHESLDESTHTHSSEHDDHEH